MRLIEFTNDDGKVEYKTEDGTPVSQDMIDKWKQMLTQTHNRITKADKFFEYIHSVKNAQK